MRGALVEELTAGEITHRLYSGGGTDLDLGLVRELQATYRLGPP